MSIGMRPQSSSATPLLLAVLWVVAFGVLGWLGVLLVPNQSYTSAAAITGFILIPSLVIWMVGKAGQQGGWALALLAGLVVFVSDATLRGGLARGLDAQSALKFGIWTAGILLAFWRWREVKAALVQPAPLALAVFGIWCLLTTTYSSTPLYTLGAAAAFLGIWVIAVCMAKVFSPQKGLAIFITALMAAMVISLAMYAVAPDRVMTPMDGGRILRLSGLFGSPNNLGRAAALTLLLVFLAWQRLRLRHALPLMAAALVVCGACLFLSGSRASALGLLVGLAVAILGRRPFLSATVLVGMACVVLVYMLVPDVRDLAISLLSRSGRAAELTTFTGRTEIWQFVLGLIGKSPWLGYGFASTRDIIPEGYAGAYGWTTTSAHNLWLQAWVTTGLIGLVLLVVSLLASLAQMFTDYLPEADSVLAFVVVVGLFEASAVGPSVNLLTFMWVWAAALRAKP